MNLVTLPTLVFGLLIASLYGALFHLFIGGGIGRLVLFLFLSWVGFLVGQLLASYLGWTFDLIGPLHVGTSTLSSFTFLITGYWLSRFEVGQQK